MCIYIYVYPRPLTYVRIPYVALNYPEPITCGQISSPPDLAFVYIRDAIPAGIKGLGLKVLGLGLGVWCLGFGI